MKLNKIVASIAVAGGLVAMSGAANAISPAWALALAAAGGAAVGSSAAYPYERPAVAVVPAAPATVVMGAGPAPSGHYELINGVNTWVPTATVVTTPGVTYYYDDDGDGVANHLDRFPHDAFRS